jgi:hypothetical protein
MPRRTQSPDVGCNHMATILKFISAFFILTIISCQPNKTGNVNNNTTEKLVIEEDIISKFQWTQLADTTKLKVFYLQLNFLNFPDDNYVGKNILDFKDSISTTALALTNKQRLELYKVVTDTSNFSEGDCGTFHLNAGFIVLDNRKVCSTIDIGCAFNQWNFNPEIPNSNHTSFNEKGLKNIEKLLDDINLKSKKWYDLK